MTALVTGDDLTSFLEQSDEYKSDLGYFAVYNISAEILENYDFGMAFQDVDERTILIFSGGEDIEARALKIAEEIHDSIWKFLKIRCTVGLGSRVNRLRDLPRSFLDARRTLEYKFVLGGDQVIFSGDLPENRDFVGAELPGCVSRICLAIRSCRPEDAQQEIDGFLTTIRRACLNRNRSIFHIQKLILSIMNELDLAALNETEIFQEERELLNAVYTKEHLSEIGGELVKFCRDLAENFRDEKDSYCKCQALRALDYIEEHYRDADVSLNSVCSYLAMSTSYFSSIFKACTGETFIEALTKKRMEKAKCLLQNTSRKTYEIASDVGYGDPHYFSSTFKKMTGMTPTEYARKVRQNGKENTAE